MLDRKIRLLALTSLFIALVYISTSIYMGSHDTFRFHLGNSMCLLAAFILPPVYGGLASGIGSMLFDITSYQNPTLGVFAYVITFATKFVMAFVAGVVFREINKRVSPKDALIQYSVDAILGGTIGEIAYIILYAIKTYVERHFVMGVINEVAIPIVIGKVGTAVFNAIAAVIISTILYRILKEMKVLGIDSF